MQLCAEIITKPATRNFFLFFSTNAALPCAAQKGHEKNSDPFFFMNAPFKKIRHWFHP